MLLFLPFFFLLPLPFLLLFGPLPTMTGPDAAALGETPRAAG